MLTYTYSGYPFHRKIEAAGRPYQELMILLSGGTVSNDSEIKEDEDDEVASSGIVIFINLSQSADRELYRTKSQL